MLTGLSYFSVILHITGPYVTYAFSRQKYFSLLSGRVFRLVTTLFFRVVSDIIVEYHLSDTSPVTYSDPSTQYLHCTVIGNNVPSLCIQQLWHTATVQQFNVVTDLCLPYAAIVVQSDSTLV